MDREPVFDLAEHAIKCIGSIGNHKFRVSFIGEQTRTICFERSVGGPDSSVGVLPTAFGMRRRTFLFKKQLPLFVPESEKTRKGDFINMLERERERPQFPCGRGLWFSGKILRHGLDLVKLTVLYRNAESFKYLRYAAFSVNHCGGNCPAVASQLVETCLVYPWRFKQRFFPPQVLFHGWRTKYADAIPSAPECHISGDNGFPGQPGRGGGGYGIKLFFNPYMTSLLLLRELRDTLAVPYIRPKECPPLASELFF